MATCVIFNPAARGHKAAQLRNQLADLATQCTLKPTYAAGSGVALAAQAVEEGFDTIIAAGGDGTVHEVVNGIGTSPGAFEKTRFGVLPIGTINVFAKELGLPKSVAMAWEVIQKGKTLSIDLPYADCVIGSSQQRKYFAQLGGAGLDSKAIDLVDLNQKKTLGPGAYVIAGFKALNRPKPEVIASSPDQGAMGQLILFGNGRYYGGTFNFFPRSNMTDGILDVLVYPKVSWPVLFEVGWGWLTQQLHESGGAIYFQTKELTLTSKEPVMLQLDGENVGYLPATISLLPRALQVIVP